MQITQNTPATFIVKDRNGVWLAFGGALILWMLGLALYIVVAGRFDLTVFAMVGLIGFPIVAHGVARRWQLVLEADYDLAVLHERRWGRQARAFKLPLRRIDHAFVQRHTVTKTDSDGLTREVPQYTLAIEYDAFSEVFEIAKGRKRRVQAVAAALNSWLAAARSGEKSNLAKCA